MSTASRSRSCDEAVLEQPGRDVDDAGLGRAVEVDVEPRRRRPRSRSTLDEALGGPWPSVTSTTRQPSAAASAHRRPRARCRRGTPRRADPSRRPVDSATLRRRRRRRRRARVVRPSASSSSSMPNGVSDHHGMPRPSACSRTSARLAVRRRAEVDAAPCPPPAAAAQDASRNSWLVATRSAARARTRSGSHTHDVGALGQLVEQQLHARRRAPARATPCPRRRCPRRSGRGCRRAGGGRRSSARGPLPDLVGEQQLAARRRPQPVLGDLEAALVGDLEPAHLLDGVAPELDPQRVLLGRREDVEDAAAHGELAALLDQVDPGVRRVREPLDGVVQSAARRRRRSATGSRSPRPGDQRLEQRADGRDHDPQRPVAGSAAIGVGEPAQHGEPAARRCRSAGRAARAAASPRPGSRRPARRAGGWRSAAARSSASRPVAVTSRTGRPAPRSLSAASRAATTGRSASGAVTSSVLPAPAAWCPGLASARNRSSAASSETTSSRPTRLTGRFPGSLGGRRGQRFGQAERPPAGERTAESNLGARPTLASRPKGYPGPFRLR